MVNSLGLEVNGPEDPASSQDADNAVTGWTQSDATADWNKPVGDGGTIGNDWAGGADTWGIDDGNDTNNAVEIGSEWGVADQPAANNWGVGEEPSMNNLDDVEEPSVNNWRASESTAEGDKPKGRGKSGKSGDGEGGIREKPYVPKPVAPRAKLTEDELAERMEKIRLQNEKIKERRVHVEADEEAFRSSIAAERARQEATRRLQAQINQNRELNAKRKLDRIGGREWDVGKKNGEWVTPKSERGTNLSHPDFQTPHSNRGRGGKPPPPRKERGGSRRSMPNSRRTPTPENSTQDDQAVSPNIDATEETENASSQTDNEVQET